MAVRKRFNRDERALIAEAQKDDGAIQWQNVTQWHAGILVSGEIVTDEYGWQHVLVINQDSTPRLSSGDVIHASPGHIRVA